MGSPVVIRLDLVDLPLKVFDHGPLQLGRDRPVVLDLLKGAIQQIYFGLSFGLKNHLSFGSRFPTLRKCSKMSVSESKRNLDQFLKPKLKPKFVLMNWVPGTLSAPAVVVVVAWHSALARTLACATSACAC